MEKLSKNSYVIYIKDEYRLFNMVDIELREEIDGESWLFLLSNNFLSFYRRWVWLFLDD